MPRSQLCSLSSAFSAARSCPDLCVPPTDRSHSGSFTRRDLIQGCGFIGDKHVQTPCRDVGNREEQQEQRTGGTPGLDGRGIGSQGHLVEAGASLVLCNGTRDHGGTTQSRRRRVERGKEMPWAFPSCRPAPPVHQCLLSPEPAGKSEQGAGKGTSQT